MADYIERDTVIDAFENADFDIRGEEFGFSLPTVRAILESIPVVYGHWEWLGPNRLAAGCMCGTCSVCKVRSKYIVNTMICPNCGAKMK